MVKKMQKAVTVLGATVLLVKSMIGSGILAVPIVLADLGYILGPLMFAAAAGMMLVSINLLLVCAEDLESKQDVSFHALTAAHFPGYERIPEIFIAIKCILVASGYLILACEEIVSVTKKFTSISALQSRYLWVTVVTAGLAPATFLKNIRVLKYTSFAGLLCIAYLFVVLFVDLAIHGISASCTNAFPASAKKAFACLPLILFSFGCQQAVFPVYSDFKTKRKKKMLESSSISIAISAAVYVATGLFGYLRHGQETKRNILENLSIENVYFCIARLSYALILLTTYPLQIFPANQSLQTIIPYSFGSEKIKKRILSIVLVLTTYAIALSTSQLDLVQKIVGSIVTPMLAFVIPAALYWKHQKQKGNKAYMAAALCAAGLAIIPFSIVLIFV